MTENTLLDLGQMTFEEAMKELDTIVRRLDVGEVTLEESLTLYKKGKLLEAFCSEKLEKAKLQVDKVIEQDGVISKVPASNLE